MSLSPPIRRLSTSTSASKREEDLINAYEAEEERIINILSRKLEQLREEKINLERAHEEESEAHVNRLARELAALRSLQQQNQSVHSNGNGWGLEDGAHASGSSSAGAGSSAAASSSVLDPSTSVLLDALKKENERLRTRLATAETDYIRVTRLNETYREELIQHRRRLGLPVDNLIGISNAEPLSQPIHRRNSTASSSPTASMVALPLQHRPSTTHSIPVPRPLAVGHRGHKPNMSSLETPISHSPSSADSPFPFSPMAPATVESYVSANTNTTTPPSSASLQQHPPAPYPNPPPTLSYPSVPPPSLSSSLGSPVVSLHMPSREPPSPVDPIPHNQYSATRLHRNSVSERRVVESGNLHDISRSRRGSVERGARIAEQGSLIRSRAGSTASTNVPANEQGSVFHPSLEETVE